MKRSVRTIDCGLDSLQLRLKQRSTTLLLENDKCIRSPRKHTAIHFQFVALESASSARSSETFTYFAFSFYSCRFGLSSCEQGKHFAVLVYYCYCEWRTSAASLECERVAFFGANVALGLRCSEHKREYIYICEMTFRTKNNSHMSTTIFLFGWSFYELLATFTDHFCCSMLVRLAFGTDTRRSCECSMLNTNSVHDTGRVLLFVDCCSSCTQCAPERGAFGGARREEEVANKTE